MSKLLHGAIIGSFGLLPAASVHAGEAERPRLTYEAFAEAVARRHPERTVDDKVVAIAKASERRAGLLPDPQLSIGRDEVPLPDRLQGEPVGDMAKDAAEWQVNLSQSFPWPGALAAEARAAKARVAATAADTGLAALARRFEASELFLRLVRTAKLIDIGRVNLAVVNGLREFAHEKFKQGIGSHMEFLQTHSDTGVLKANVAALELDLRNLKRHALVLMDQNTDGDLDAVDFALEWPPSLIGERGTTSDPTEDFARARIVRAKEVELARQDAEYRRSLPSFTASGMVMEEDGGMRMYGAMLGVTLPVFSSARRSSLSAERAIVEGRAADELSWHDRRKMLALSQAEARAAQIEANLKALAGEIIPPVREHLEAATAQFGQGKGDIAAIIEGRRTLLNLEMTEIRATEALAQARLDVEKVKAGLVDEVIDQEVPQLAGATGGSMTMGGGAGSRQGAGMQGMPAARRAMPMKKGVPGGRRPAPGMNKQEDERSTDRMQQGMGM